MPIMSFLIENYIIRNLLRLVVEWGFAFALVHSKIVDGRLGTTNTRPEDRHGSGDKVATQGVISYSKYEKIRDRAASMTFVGKGGTLWMTLLLSVFTVRTNGQSSLPSAYWSAFTCSANNAFLAVAGSEGIWLSTSGGDSWTNVVTEYSGWSSMTSATDGQYLAATTEGSSIWTSSDYGVTWNTNNFLNRVSDWVSISANSSGEQMIAASASNGVWISYSYGSNWTIWTDSVPLNWAGVASSGPGLYVYAAAVSQGGVFVSSNRGKSWSETSLSKTTEYYSVVCDTTGRYVAVASEEGIYISVDYGGNFVVSPATQPYFWSQLSMDLSGQYIVATLQDTNVAVGNIWVSQNYGATWNQSVAPYLTYNFAKVIPSGEAIFAASESISPLLVSYDLGGSWTTLTNNIVLSAVTFAGDYIVAAEYGGGFYRTPTSETHGLLPVGALLTEFWTSMVSDISGIYVYAASNNGGLWYSTNGGRRWDLTSLLFNADWTAIDCSSDGQYVVTTSPLSTIGVWLSSDYGSSWTAAQLDSGEIWQGIATDSSGQYIAVCSSASYGAAVSHDYGSSWLTVLVNSEIPWYSVSIDGTGKYMVIAGDAGLYASSDYGQSFSQAYNSEDLNCCGTLVAMASSSSLGYALLDNEIYQTINYGLNWTLVNYPPASFTSLSVSPSGEFLVGASISNGNVYVSQNEAESWILVPIFSTNFPSSNPTGVPSSEPSSQPSRLPTSQPTIVPSTCPSTTPSIIPSSAPSGMPSSYPSNQPSGSPTSWPSSFPTNQPSGNPTNQPSSTPTAQPSLMPTGQPTSHPSVIPPCRVGTYYVLEADSYLCIPCASGTVSAEGSHECTACQAGTYAMVNVSTCQQCPFNSYQPDALATECRSCNQGYVTGSEGSTASGDCVNPSGSIVGGWISIFFCVIIIWAYLYRGRLQRIAFNRKSRLIGKAIIIAGAAARVIDLMTAAGIIITSRSRKKSTLSTSLKTFLFGFMSMFLLVFVVILVILAGIIHALFNSLVIWRGYSVQFSLKLSFAQQIQLFFSIIAKYIGIPYLEVLAYPFAYVSDYIASIRINFAAVKVSCAGSQAPLYLIADILVICAIMVAIRSDVQIYWRAALEKLMIKAMGLSFNATYMKTMKTSALSYFGLSILIFSLPGPQKLIQYALGLVYIELFFTENGRGRSNANCDAAFSAPLDTILAISTTVLVYICAFPVFFIISQVIIPTFKLNYSSPTAAKTTPKNVAGIDGIVRSSADSMSLRKTRSDSNLDDALQDSFSYAGSPSIDSKASENSHGSYTKQSKADLYTYPVLTRLRVFFSTVVKLTTFLISFDWLFVKTMCFFTERIFHNIKTFLLTSKKVRLKDIDPLTTILGEGDQQASMLEEIKDTAFHYAIPTLPPWFVVLRDLFFSDSHAKFEKFDEKARWRADKRRFPTYLKVVRKVQVDFATWVDHTFTLAPSNDNHATNHNSIIRGSSTSSVDMDMSSNDNRISSASSVASARSSPNNPFLTGLLSVIRMMLKTIFQPFSFVFCCQWVTAYGRAVWYRVAKNYFLSMLLLVGYWPDYLVDEFRLLEDYADFLLLLNTVEDSCKEMARGSTAMRGASDFSGQSARIAKELQKELEERARRRRQLQQQQSERMVSRDGREDRMASKDMRTTSTADAILARNFSFTAFFRMSDLHRHSSVNPSTVQTQPVVVELTSKRQESTVDAVAVSGGNDGWRLYQASVDLMAAGQDPSLSSNKNGSDLSVLFPQHPVARYQTLNMDATTKVVNDPRFLFQSYLSAMVSIRVVLLQLVPVLTVVSIFAVELSSCPLCVTDKRLKQMLPPLWVQHPWTRARRLLLEDYSGAGHNTTSDTNAANISAGTTSGTTAGSVAEAGVDAGTSSHSSSAVDVPHWKIYALGTFIFTRQSRIVDFVLVITANMTSIGLVFFPDQVEGLVVLLIIELIFVGLAYWCFAVLFLHKFFFPLHAEDNHSSEGHDSTTNSLRLEALAVMQDEANHHSNDGIYQEGKYSDGDAHMVVENPLAKYQRQPDKVHGV